MNIKINETGEIKTLGIIDSQSGVNWVQDLIGNSGAMIDGQFVWSEEDNAYLASQSTYDWWVGYISDSEDTEHEIVALAERLNISEGIVRERVADFMANATDYDIHRQVSRMAMAEVSAEYTQRS